MRAARELSTWQRMQEETTVDMARRHTITQERWEAVWERSRAGRHTVVVGPHTLPPAPHDLKVLHVRCDALGTSGGVLDAARRSVADLLGEERHAPEPRCAAFERGLRQRLWGDMPAPSLDAQLVEACNRLAAQTAGRAVLAFEAIDAADAATLDTLAQIFQRPGWLRLPFLFTVRGTLQGRVAEFVSLLHHADGEAAVMEIEDEAPLDEVITPCDWTLLPAHVLRILRASAVLGTLFEVELVAYLLEEPLGVVLEKLQEATDAGVPLADRGDGQFTWPARIVTALQKSTLPSLLMFWHRRLGEILSGGKPSDRAGRPSGVPQMVARGPSTAQAEEAWDPSQRDPEADLAKLLEPPRHAVLPIQTAPAETVRSPVAEEREQTMGAHPKAEQTAPPSHLVGDQTRAATHLQTAGRTEAAIEHYLAAVREAAARGDVQRAYGVAEQALTLLDQLPPSPPHALLRAQLLLERGGLQWHGALLGSACTLHEALASLEAAKTSLPDDVPPEVIEQLATVIAGVCYDVGDQAALQRALAELREGGHRLVQAGAVLPAARLLNDEAAVAMRLGDPVCATYLLLSQAHESMDRAPDHGCLTIARTVVQRGGQARDTKPREQFEHLFGQGGPGLEPIEHEPRLEGFIHHPYALQHLADPQGGPQIEWRG